METSTIEKSEVKKVGRPAVKYVTAEEFQGVTDILKLMSEQLTELKNRPLVATVQTPESVEVAKAKFDQAPINPAWEEKAREIVGEAMSHCEVFYPKQGGVIFTVIIKDEFSNAPKEYLEMRKSDRRSREIGSEGISGVETWCKLIKQNLRRGK